MKNNLIYILIGFILLTAFGIYFFLNSSKPLPERKTESVKKEEIKKGLEPQRVSSGTVETTVTPKNISEGEVVFDVVLDTHSGSLDIDLVKSSILLDDKGTAYKSTSWEGDPIGGHHRTGVLKFGGIIPSPTYIELIIKQTDSSESKFKWELKK